MTLRKRNLQKILLYLLGFFGLGIVTNLFSRHPPFLDPNSVFFALFMIWTVSVYRRVVNHRTRRLLMGMGLFMLLFFLARFAKYACFFPEKVQRLLWYFFYLPMTAVPLMSFLAALHLGKSELEKPSRGWSLLYIPFFALVLAFLTNDRHQLAFCFEPGFAGWSRHYTHGFVYYLAILWIAVLLIASLGIAVRRSTLSASRKYLWVPLLAPAVSIVYFVCYSRILLMPRTFLALPEIFCFMIAGMWEGCIQIGLVPSNVGYAEFFRRSHLDARISDRNGNTVYTAEPDGRPTRNRHFVLHTQTIRGGYVRWAEDVSEIDRLRDALTEANARLTEESDLLAAENALREARAQITEQNRLYSEIAELVRPQTQAISLLVQEAETDRTKASENMARACFLTAYVKRRANLTLRAKHEDVLPAQELMLSLRESMDYLSHCGIPCLCTGNPSDRLPTEVVLSAYDAFEAIVEDALPTLSGLIVRAASDEDGFSLRLMLETPRVQAPLNPGPLEIHIDPSDDAFLVLLQYRKGGENA